MWANMILCTLDQVRRQAPGHEPHCSKTLAAVILRAKSLNGQSTDPSADEVIEQKDGGLGRRGYCFIAHIAILQKF